MAIDEFSVDERCTLPYRWMKRGKSGTMITQPRKRAWSCILGISRNGRVIIHVKQESVNSEDICEFLNDIKKYVSKEKNPLKSVVVWADNARNHTAYVCRDLAERLNIKVLLNAPYTPEFMPCEFFIKALKLRLRRHILNLK